jgi:hypothetical protein
MCELPGHTYDECLVFFEEPGMTITYGRHDLGHFFLRKVTLY